MSSSTTRRIVVSSEFVRLAYDYFLRMVAIFSENTNKYHGFDGESYVVVMFRGWLYVTLHIFFQYI